jgi:hypothetical protein
MDNVRRYALNTLKTQLEVIMEALDHYLREEEDAKGNRAPEKVRYVIEELNHAITAINAATRYIENASNTLKAPAKASPKIQA